MQRQEPTILEQTRSLSEIQSHPNEGAATLGTSRKWILVYGLLGCLFIVAVASLKFGHALLTHLPVDGGRWASFGSKTLARGKSLSAEAIEVKTPTREAAAEPRTIPPLSLRKTKTMPAAAPTHSAEPPDSISHAENKSGSSVAEAIRAERPMLPADIQSSITSDNVVKVRVRIDESGRVTDATVFSATGPVVASLESYALDTARHWRFRPARNNGKAIRSDRVLEFLFRPSDC